MTQPEFSTGRRMMGLIGLLEQRKLVSAMLPSQPDSFGVQVVIGKENREELIQDYSVVASRYGLPDEAVGTIGVVGPTRMPYARTISAIGYMASMMSRLVAELYGVKLTDDGQQPGDN
jgi:heat-inducible transcriptional repressor